MVLVGRYPHQRRNSDSSAERTLGFDGFNADAAVLHVVHHEFRTRGGGNLCKAGCEELEDHCAHRHLAVLDALLQRCLAHFVCLLILSRPVRPHSPVFVVRPRPQFAFSAKALTTLLFTAGAVAATNAT